MIDDLDRSVEELLRRELSPGLVEQVGISFAAPDSDFPPSSVTLPAVDLFLYDIRENLELRNTAWRVEHREDGTAVRQRGPVRVDCSYLITAWASEGSPTRALDEHRLLSEVMKVLLKYPIIPEVLLQGTLKRQEPPLPSSTLQPGRLQSVSEFWQALGGKPKAALNYTVTFGVFPDRDEETERPVTDKTTKVRGELGRKQWQTS
jgi:Pvc16 N-terminal domain